MQPLMTAWLRISSAPPGSELRRAPSTADTRGVGSDSRAAGGFWTYANTCVRLTRKHIKPTQVHDVATRGTAYESHAPQQLWLAGYLTLKQN